jgi:hypothetical protein
VNLTVKPVLLQPFVMYVKLVQLMLDGELVIIVEIVKMSILQHVLVPPLLLHAIQDIILMTLLVPHVKHVKTIVLLVLDQELDHLMFINVNLVPVLMS